MNRPERATCKSESGYVCAWIDLTRRCNLLCPYCYTASGTEQDAELSLQEIGMLCSDLSRIGITKLMLSGGEPCTRRDLPEIIEQAGASGHSIVLVTNGTLMTDATIAALKRTRTTVQVSVDSLDPIVYLKCRGRNRLPIVVRNIDLLLHNGVPVTLSNTITSDNKTQVSALVEFALDRGIGIVHFGAVVAVGRGAISRRLVLRNWYPILLELYKLQKEYHEYLGIDVIEGLVLSLIGANRSGCYCNAMAGRAFEVGSDGTVCRCGGLGTLGRFILGNVKTESLRQILARSRDQRLLDPISVETIPGCINCPIRMMCKGGCRAEAYACSGGDFWARSSLCGGMKKICGEILREEKIGLLDEYIGFLKDREVAETDEGIVKYL